MDGLRVSNFFANVYSIYSFIMHSIKTLVDGETFSVLPFNGYFLTHILISK